MSHLAPSVQTILEIEQRQDEVLRLLDQLEQRVQQALAEFAVSPRAEAPPPAAALPAVQVA
jgi:hypothetical protein